MLRGGVASKKKVSWDPVKTFLISNQGPNQVGGCQPTLDGHPAWVPVFSVGRVPDAVLNRPMIPGNCEGPWGRNGSAKQALSEHTVCMQGVYARCVLQVVVGSSNSSRYADQKDLAHSSFSTL